MPLWFQPVFMDGADGRKTQEEDGGVSLRTAVIDEAQQKHRNSRQRSARPMAFSVLQDAACVFHSTVSHPRFSSTRFCLSSFISPAWSGKIHVSTAPYVFLPHHKTGFAPPEVSMKTTSRCPHPSDGEIKRLQPGLRRCLAPAAVLAIVLAPPRRCQTPATAAARGSAVRAAS